jgi:hypothetical protein
MNRGALGARPLNIELQKELNPPGEVRSEQLETPQHLYGPGVGAVTQSKDGGLVRPSIFPPGGEHPLGGPGP